MANNRETSEGRKRQIIYSEPRKIFVDKKLSKKGRRLILQAKTKKEEDQIWQLYGRNKYRINPNAKPIKVITHK